MKSAFDLSIKDLGIQARRAQGNWLRLGFQVAAPQQVTLRLLCFQSAWVFEEDLGLVLPGHDRAELQLLDWPQEATLLQVEFRTAEGPVECLNHWLAAPCLQTPYLCS